MEYHYHKIIEELQKRGSSPGLDAVRGLLDVLGHPEERLKIVHIAGTNGKGSVFAFLASVLKESGYRVGRYISPTIRSYEERFQINGEEIRPEKLEQYYARMERAMEQMEEMQTEQSRERIEQQSGQSSAGGQPERLPTLFEVETALAFLYFAEEGVDFALIETGMGGTFDATNVIEHPILTVISSVSYDHKAFLGDTLPEIAGQKAGIMKEGVPVIVSENVPEVCEIIGEKAREKHASCIFLKENDYQVEEETATGSTFIWKKHRFTNRSAGTPSDFQCGDGSRGSRDVVGDGGAVTERLSGRKDVRAWTDGDRTTVRIRPSGHQSDARIRFGGRHHADRKL